MKRRVLYILGSDYTYGGIEVAINSALPDFVEEMEFKLICTGNLNLDFARKIPGSILEDNVIALNQNSLPKLFTGSIKAIKENIKHFSPEIVVLSLWKAVVLYSRLRSVLKDKKVVLFIHSTKFTHALDSFFNKVGMKFSTIIFADSRSSAKWIKSMTDNDVKQISLLREHADFENKNRLNKDVIRLISVSRISPEKGFDHMLLFIKKLIEGRRDFIWDIYGSTTDQQEKQKIEQFIEQNNLTDKIAFKGPIQPSDVYDAMSEYDFFIQFSLYEGMAMSVSEAMSCGLVCLVHPVGEIPYYSEDMHSAIFIPELTNNGIDKIYEKFVKVTSDDALYREISQNAIKQFKSQQIFSESFCEAINEL